MRAQITPILTLLATLSVSTIAVAQTARPTTPGPAAASVAAAPVAPAAKAQAKAPAINPPPAAAPRAPAAPPAGATQAQAGTATAPAAADAEGVFTLRDAPKAQNPVLAAFTPKPGGLTANEVAAKAVATSDTIASKNAELRAAAAAVDSAMYQFYPRLALKASYTRLSPVDVSLGSGGFSVGAQNQGGIFVDVPAGGGRQPVVDSNNVPIGAQPFSFALPKNAYSLGASLAVPISDYVLRLSDSIDATKRNEEASQLNVIAARQKVEADARIAFYNWTLAIGQVAVTEKSLERVKARLKDTQTAFTLGAATKADVLRMEALVAGTESGLETSKAFKQLSEEQLAIIMDSQPQEFELGENVLEERNVAPLQSLDSLVKEANANRVELKAMDKTVESMHSAETVLRRGELPRIDGLANYAYANPNQRYMFVAEWKQSWDVGLAATWNINEIFTNNSSANEMVAKRQAAEANRKALAKGIRLEVSSAYSDARKSAAELESAKRAAEAAQSAYDTAVELYKVGKATTTELIDSESELVNALLKLISAHIGARVAETKIAQSTGRNLETVKY